MAWAPAAEDAARSEYLRQVAAGESAVGFADDRRPDEDEDEGKDGRDGMLELGMRFVGSWIEFAGLRINPARDLLVIDDLIVDVDPGADQAHRDDAVRRHPDPDLAPARAAASAARTS